MKFNVEVDCSPEEARRLMGLPDLTPVHERYVATLSNMVEGKVSPELLESIMKSWTPMGEAGVAMWRQLFEAGARGDG